MVNDGVQDAKNAFFIKDAVDYHNTYSPTI